MNRGIFLVFFLAIVSSSHAQNGINIQAGVGSLISNNESFTNNGEAHYGLRAGASGRIGGASFFFRPGLYYERYHAFSSSTFNLFDKEDQLHFIKGHANLGLNLIRSNSFKLRLYGGGLVSYLAAIDNRGDHYVLDDFNDASFGVNFGMGIDILFITLDGGYERGITRFLTSDDDSRSHYYHLSLGVFF